MMQDELVLQRLQYGLFSVAFSLLFCSVLLHDKDSTFSLVSINIFNYRYRQTVSGPYLKD